MIFYKLSPLIVLKRFIKLPTQRYGNLQRLFGWKLFVVAPIYNLGQEPGLGFDMEDWEKKLLREWKDEALSLPSKEENASAENISRLMSEFKLALSEHVKKYPNWSIFTLENEHASFRISDDMILMQSHRHTRVERSEITKLRNEIRNLPENQGKPWRQIWEDLKL